MGDPDGADDRNPGKPLALGRKGPKSQDPASVDPNESPERGFDTSIQGPKFPRTQLTQKPKLHAKDADGVEDEPDQDYGVQRDAEEEQSPDEFGNFEDEPDARDGPTPLATRKKKPRKPAETNDDDDDSP